MAKSKSNSKMWVAGAILGAVAGAAYALWKTPMSGQELRGKLSTGPIAQRDDAVQVEKMHTPGMADTMLSKLEHTLAPIVGVELGKTASGSNGAVTAPITPLRLDVTPPTPVTPATPATPPTPATPAEPVAGFGSQTIRAKRFAWGSPAPEASDASAAVETHAEIPVPGPGFAAADNTKQSSDSAPIIAPDPDPAPVAAGVGTGAMPDYGAQTIRTKRFAWGDPAPEAASAPSVADQIEQPTVPVETVAVAAASIGGAVKDVTKSSFRAFPNLGGLEQ